MGIPPKPASCARQDRNARLPESVPGASLPLLLLLPVCVVVLRPFPHAHRTALPSRFLFDTSSLSSPTAANASLPHRRRLVGCPPFPSLARLDRLFVFHALFTSVSLSCVCLLLLRLCCLRVTCSRFERVDCARGVADSCPLFSSSRPCLHLRCLCVSLCGCECEARVGGAGTSLQCPPVPPFCRFASILLFAFPV